MRTGRVNGQSVGTATRPLPLAVIGTGFRNLTCVRLAKFKNIYGTTRKGAFMNLKLGAYGPEVSAYKLDLIRLGYDLDNRGLNEGAFGPKTDSETRKFQKANGLVVDGWAGRLTLLKVAYLISRLDGEEQKPPLGEVKPTYWEPGPYHPMFVVPKGYTHLHPIDILRSVAGEREIYGSQDNPMIAHFHEHSGNLGHHSEGADYHDEVPHCASAQNWAADGAGCEKSNNALASSWGKPYSDKYKANVYKVGSMVPQGALICLGSHITLANREFHYNGKGSFEGYGSNQSNTIKTSTFSQSSIKNICDFVPKEGTRLAPIGTKPVPSTGTGTDSTR